MSDDEFGTGTANGSMRASNFSLGGGKGGFSAPLGNMLMS
jgi:hypothetical protein